MGVGLGTDTVSLARLGAQMTDLDFPRRPWPRRVDSPNGSVLMSGMQVTGLVEHDSVPGEALPGQMQQVEGGGWRLADLPWRLPHTYTIRAVRPPD
jgi:hypothetical protein